MAQVRQYIDGRITPHATEFALTTLTPGQVYVFRQSMDLGWFLTPKVEGFTLPPKLYGSVEQRTSRVLTTFRRKKQLGVAMFGLKGSGKSLLAASILLGSGLPIIDLDQAVPIQILTNFFGVLGPVAVRIDEVEKIFDQDDQVGLLTFLDSTHSSERLVVLTANDSSKLLDPFRNRPGRLWYAFQYRGLEEDFVREYLDDYLNTEVPAEYREMILTRAEALGETLSFDLLRAMVEETNEWFHVMTPQAVMEPLNMEFKPVEYRWTSGFSWSTPLNSLTMVTNAGVYASDSRELLSNLGTIYSCSALIRRIKPLEKRPRSDEEEEDEDFYDSEDLPLLDMEVSALSDMYDPTKYEKINFHLATQGARHLVAEEPKRVVLGYPIITGGRIDMALCREIGISIPLTREKVMQEFTAMQDLMLYLTFERKNKIEYRRWSAF